MANVNRHPQRKAQIEASTGAPTRGLNTVDSLPLMDPTYAISLQNWIATPQGLSFRKGYRKWATGLPASVTTLLTYNSRTTSGSKLFAVSGSAIYDVTTGGPAGAPAVSGLNASAPYWQSTSQTYSTGSANYLVAVNGSDFPRLFDGSTWTTCSQPVTPAGPGQFNQLDNNGNAVNIQSFIDVTLHRQRLWFVRENTTTAYYCDIAQVGGKLYPFDFGPFFPRGGKLLKLAIWTMDAGGTAGDQSVLVAISNKGDIAVYTGDNPASASTWQLSGSYQVASPVGRRCTTQYEGDLLILTQDGLYPMSKYLRSERLDTTSAISYAISPTISDLVSTLATQPGFEMTAYPGSNVMMLNIPQSNQVNNFQFCYHTVTRGWSQFTGWPAQCFTVFNDAMYFGGTDYVALAFIGYSDGADISGAGGNNIVATGLSAFSTMDAPGVRKHAKMVKPYIVTGQANPAIRVGVNVDFNLVPIIGSATVNPVTGAVWDNAIWDNPNATWVGTLTTRNSWATPRSNPGDYLAVAISVSAVSDTLWVGTNWRLTTGSVSG